MTDVQNHTVDPPNLDDPDDSGLAASDVSEDEAQAETPKAKPKLRIGGAKPKADGAKVTGKAGAKGDGPKVRKAGKATVKGAGTGAVITAAQKRAVEAIKKQLDGIEGLKKTESDRMWKVAEAVHVLVTGDDETPPLRQGVVAEMLGYNGGSIISNWDKTWRLFGMPGARVLGKNGEPQSFNDHLDRARLSESGGEVKDRFKDVVDAADKYMNENDVSFSSALREVKGGKGTRAAQQHMTIASARDRVHALTSHIDDFLPEDGVDDTDVQTMLLMVDDVLTALGVIMVRAEEAQPPVVFSDAHKSQAARLAGIAAEQFGKVG